LLSLIASTIIFLPKSQSLPNLRFFDIALDISSFEIVTSLTWLALNSYKFNDRKNHISKEYVFDTDLFKEITINSFFVWYVSSLQFIFVSTLIHQTNMKSYDRYEGYYTVEIVTQVTMSLVNHTCIKIDTVVQKIYEMESVRIR